MLLKIFGIAGVVSTSACGLFGLWIGTQKRGMDTAIWSGCFWFFGAAIIWSILAGILIAVGVLK